MQVFYSPNLLGRGDNEDSLVAEERERKRRRGRERGRERGKIIRREEETSG